MERAGGRATAVSPRPRGGASSPRWVTRRAWASHQLVHLRVQVAAAAALCVPGGASGRQGRLGSQHCALGPGPACCACLAWPCRRRWPALTGGARRQALGALRRAPCPPPTWWSPRRQHSPPGPAAEVGPRAAARPSSAGTGATTTDVLLLTAPSRPGPCARLHGPGERGGGSQRPRGSAQKSGRRGCVPGSWGGACPPRWPCRGGCRSQRQTPPGTCLDSDRGGRGRPLARLPACSHGPSNGAADQPRRQGRPGMPAPSARGAAASPAALSVPTGGSLGLPVSLYGRALTPGERAALPQAGRPGCSRGEG